MRFVIKSLAVLAIFLIIFFGIMLFAGVKICPFGAPIDRDGNGVPENCLVTSGD